MRPIFYKIKPKLPAGTKEIDAYARAVRELQRLKPFVGRVPKTRKNWIHFPWTNKLVCTVDEETYWLLRTNRNRDIITSAEQDRFRKLIVGIAGLSVGSGIFHSLVRSGGPQNIKIADYDNLEITNLNRINADLLDIGQNKTALAAQAAYQVDPFLKLTCFDQGLNANNIKDFIGDKPKLNIFVDAMDNFELKLLARAWCKKFRVPVMMATDNGFGVILDIERFDLEPNRPVFHGRLKKYDLSRLDKLSRQDWLNLAILVLDPKNLSAGIQRSLPNLGKSLAAIPQLGLSASLAGAAVTTALIKLANKAPLPSGRHLINLDNLIA